MRTGAGWHRDGRLSRARTARQAVSDRAGKAKSGGQPTADRVAATFRQLAASGPMRITTGSNTWERAARRRLAPRRQLGQRRGQGPTRFLLPFLPRSGKPSDVTVVPRSWPGRRRRHLPRPAPARPSTTVSRSIQISARTRPSPLPPRRPRRPRRLRLSRGSTRRNTSVRSIRRPVRNWTARRPGEPGGLVGQMTLGQARLYPTTPHPGSGSGRASLACGPWRGGWCPASSQSPHPAWPAWPARLRARARPPSSAVVSVPPPRRASRSPGRKPALPRPAVSARSAEPMAAGQEARHPAGRDPGKLTRLLMSVQPASHGQACRDGVARRRPGAGHQRGFPPRGH